MLGKMPGHPSWSRLIRFVSADGRIVYGEPVGNDHDSDLGALVDRGNLEAKIIEAGPEGPLSETAKVSDKTVAVKKLLGPLGPELVPDIKCIGLNYRQHIVEAKRKLPPFPSLFIKPATALADYGEAVPIPKVAQDNEADYEGELCAIIGEDCKDVSVEDALSYVVGYTCGDDVSSRKWQRDLSRAGVVPQWCFSKGFDKFAPLGPCIVSSKTIPDPSKLHMDVWVNGELRQSTSINDLVFPVAELVSFLSQGTTLRRGTVIMTGTPGGVGCSGPEENWRALRHGDQVEVGIEPIGRLRHSVVYE